MPGPHVRAEWVRAFGFVLAASGMALTALVDLSDQTVVWLLGLAVTAIAVVALFSAAFAIGGGREFFAAVARRRPAAAIRALADLNRIPIAPAPHRTPRLIVMVFGPLSGAAGLVMVVRMATL